MRFQMLLKIGLERPCTEPGANVDFLHPYGAKSMFLTIASDPKYVVKQRCDCKIVISKRTKCAGEGQGGVRRVSGGGQEWVRRGSGGGLGSPW